MLYLLNYIHSNCLIEKTLTIGFMRPVGSLKSSVIHIKISFIYEYTQ